MDFMNLLPIDIDSKPEYIVLIMETTVTHGPAQSD